MPARTPEEAARLANTIVVRCANDHLPITWSSRRDQPVPCPVCGRVVQPRPAPEDR